jgi:ferredoxin-NADP reductase
MYASLAIANREEASPYPERAGSVLPVHSGQRSGHIFQGFHRQDFTVTKQVLCRVRRKDAVQIAKAVFLFTFEMVGRQCRSITLEPGQWITLSLPCNPNPMQRTWTVVETGEDFFFRIAVKVHPGNKGGGLWLLENAEATLSLSDIGGDFYLGHHAHRIRSKCGRVLMVTAGIGITPIWASVNTELIVRRGRQPWRSLRIVHIHVDRTAGDVPFLEPLRTLDRQLAGGGPFSYSFHLHTTQESSSSSTPANASHWITKEEVGGAVTSTFPVADAFVMLCGPPAFMESMRLYLAELGASQENIASERFAR